MKKTIKKSGQKFFKRFSKASAQAGAESKEHIKENLLGRFSHIENIRLLILEWGLMMVALIMLAVTQAFWFGDSYAEDTYVTGGTYIEATLGEVNSMNPLFATTSSEKTLSRLMFATLAAIDYSGHPGIGLAQSISPSEGGRVWTVRLRDDLKWSDGEPITNTDVIFTANLIKNPAVNSIYDSSLTNVKVAENENGEIVFTLPVAYADFISALIFPVLPEHILGEVDPRTLIEHNFSSTPVVSGAFMLNASQSGAANNETVIYLSANSNYYKGKPMLNGFAVHTYNTRDEIVAAIKTGAVTATAELTNMNKELAGIGQFAVKESSLNSGAFLFFNTGSTTMKDRAMRTAIRQGIDMEKIRSTAPGTTKIDYPLLKSQIELANYPIIPERDFEAAKAKIAELSNGTTLSLEVATVSSGYLPDVADAIAEELRALGFNVNVSKYEENQDFINNVISKRSYDILVYEVELGADPDPLPYYHSSQASATGLNLSSYKNSLVDDLLLGARDSLDMNLRAKKYEVFLEHWVADTPAIGLYQPNLTYYYNRNVRTFGNDIRLVTALDRFTDVGNWAVNKATKNRTP